MKQRMLRFKLLTRMFYQDPEQKAKPVKSKKDLTISAENLQHLDNKLATPNSQKPDDKKVIPAQENPSISHESHHHAAYQPLQSEQWKEKLREFTEYTVIKMTRVFQTVFYLLQYERDDLCERDTNKLEWKKAKRYIDDNFFKRLGGYNPIGPKDGEYREYQKLRFLEKNVEGIEPEHVDDYSIPLGRLYRWLLFAIDMRKEDVNNRRDHKQKLRDDRQAQQDLSDERLRNRDRDLEAARTVLSL